MSAPSNTGVDPRSREERQHPNRLAYPPVEAASLIGVSRSRIYELLTTGEIPSLKIGRNRRIRHEDLQGFLDRLAAEQSSGGGAG